MYQMKRFIIDMEQSPLSIFFAFINLVCVQPLIQLLNTPFIFSVMIKDFSISFSRVIIVQDFETVTFLCYVLFGYKPTSVILC